MLGLVLEVPLKYHIRFGKKLSHHPFSLYSGIERRIRDRRH